MIKNLDTITTGAVSLAAVEVAPHVADIAANAVNLPISDVLGIFLQVITGVATLYKLFFFKSKKKTEDNV
jgi:hypothetical protein